MNLTETMRAAAGEVVDAVQSTPVDTAVIRLQLAERTGLTETEITSEIIARYAKFDEDVRTGLDFLAIKSAATPAEKVRLLHSVLEAQEAEALSLGDRATQAAEGAIDAVTEAAGDAVETGTQAAADAASSGIDNWFQGKLGKFGDFFKDFSIGGIIKKFLISLFPASWGMAKWFGEEKEIVEDQDKIRGGEDAPNSKAPEVEPVVDVDVPQVTDAPNTVEISPEMLGKRKSAESLGYRGIIQISGINYGKGGEPSGIYEVLGNQSIFELQGSMLGNVDYQSEFNIPDIYSNTGIKMALIGLTGPIVESMLDGRIGVDQIQDIIGYTDEGNFNTLAKTYFSNEELTVITSSGFRYKQLPLNIVSRLLTLSHRDAVIGVAQMTSKAALSIGATFTNAMFGEGVKEGLNELFADEQAENDIYPGGMAGVLMNNLGKASRNASVETIIGSDSISPEDRARLEDFVSFRDSIFPHIQENFSLGLDSFSNTLSGSVTNGQMLGLFLALGGKDITNLSESDNVIIYAWSYNILPAGEQGSYTAKMIREIAEGASNHKRSMVMTAVLFRISQFDRSLTLNAAERTISGADRLVMDQVKATLPGAFEGNPWALRIATWAVEVGGFTLLMKLLFKMPIMRAVLIATSGVLGATIYFGLKEGIYTSLNSDVKGIYDSYLDKLIASGSLGDHTRGTLSTGINNDSIGYAQIMSWLGATDFSAIVGESLS